MFTLALGPDMATVAALVYIMALPGLLVYCLALLWALSRSGWKRKAAVVLSFVWAAVFPLAFLLMMQVGVGGNDGVRIAIVVVACSVLSAVFLSFSTGLWEPVIGCAAGALLAGGGSALAFSERVESPLSLSLLAVLWAIPVGVSLVLWGRKAEQRRVPLCVCSACGYDLAGTSGALCPECGKPANRESGLG